MADGAGHSPGPQSGLVTVVGWEMRCTEGSSDKYYRIVLADRVVVVNWGRTGTAGGLKVHRTSGPGAARAQALKLTGEKEARGYELVRDTTSFRAAARLVEATRAGGTQDQSQAARDLVDLFIGFPEDDVRSGS